MDLAVTPTGRLICVESKAEKSTLESPPQAAADRHGEKIARAFAAGQAAGLFALATERFDAAPRPSFGFWRDFAGNYLTALCHIPAKAEADFEPIPPPAASELESFVVNTPPMQGAEYVTTGVLEGLWTDLDGWVRHEVAGSEEGLAGFLKRRAPLWHQVGRVCFHLAENRRDPNYPFAFLATYAPRLAAGARVQYQPLSQALREYAGAKNKNALVKLLSPIQLASEKSRLARQLVESGDLYQPLAWTPREAYRFLKEVPHFEESGILVRLPDWWKKRPRPRVGVTIGDRKQSTFGADGMLDFRVEMALGDEKLTAAELRQLMAADDGLVLFKGQWVEVDRKKLNQALEHWKKVEQHAGDGLSFVEGMRLLAGASADLSAEDGREVAEREWSFVHAGKWLGPVIEQLRNPGRPGGCSGRPCPDRNASSLPENGRRLAVVLIQPGVGGMPGRRHGARKDNPGAGFARGAEKGKGIAAVALGGARVAACQLEVGDGAVRADASSPVRPPFRDPAGRVGPNGRAAGSSHPGGRSLPDDLCDVVAPAVVV